MGKDRELSPLAESWECSTHPDGLSLVADGEYAGVPLPELLRMHPEYLGSRVRRERSRDVGQLPVLVKFIDAKKDLSVQVHPTDDYAEKFENGQAGKSELWYILDAGLFFSVHKATACSLAASSPAGSPAYSGFPRLPDRLG